jgi:hypothetical protein
MIEFSIKVKLPSGITIRVPELNNKIYLVLVKYCENADYEGFNNTINEYLNIPNNLDILDRFYLLVYYRMIFVDDNIHLNIKDRALNLNLDIILNKINNIYDDFVEVITVNDISLTVGLPTTLYFTNIDDIYNNIIKSINYKDTFTDFSLLSNKEKEFVMSYLPAKVFYSLKQYILKLSNLLTDFILIDEVEEFDIKQHKIDIISNGVVTFLSSIYSTNLLYYYELVYSYLTNISSDIDFYNGLSPIETKVIVNIRNKDVEEKNEELKSRQE